MISAALRVCERSRNDFASFGRLSVRSDSLAERGGFEPEPEGEDGTPEDEESGV